MRDLIALTARRHECNAVDVLYVKRHCATVSFKVFPDTSSGARPWVQVLKTVFASGTLYFIGLTSTAPGFSKLYFNNL